MTPHLLRTFLSVARHLNFTRAAGELLTSQPAVSRQIAQLEQEVGGPLFERLGRNVHLTDAGRTLVPLAEQILGQIERAVEAVRGRVGSVVGRLHIGASTTPGLYLLPRVLGRFHQRHPDIDLRLTVENSLGIEQAVLSNELDLGFIGAHLVNKTLSIVPVADDEIVCFCGAAHLLAKRERVAPTVLTDQTWIVREAGSATRQLFEQWLAGVGIRMQKFMEMKSPEGIKALVQAGIGISFMSRYGLEKEFRSRSLARINLAGPRLTRPIFLVRHPDKHESRPMRQLLALLSQVSSQHDRRE